MKRRFCNNDSGKRFIIRTKDSSYNKKERDWIAKHNGQTVTMLTYCGLPSARFQAEDGTCGWAWPVEVDEEHKEDKCLE